MLLKTYVLKFRNGFSCKVIGLWLLYPKKNCKLLCSLSVSIELI